MRSVSSIAEGRAATVRDEHRAAAAVKWKREEKALAHSWQQGKVSSEPPPEHHCSPAWLVAATTLSVCIRNSSSHSEGLTAAVVVAGRREAGQVILRDSHNHSACSGGFERACLPREPPADATPTTRVQTARWQCCSPNATTANGQPLSENLSNACDRSSPGLFVTLPAACDGPGADAVPGTKDRDRKWNLAADADPAAKPPLLRSGPGSPHSPTVSTDAASSLQCQPPTAWAWLRDVISRRTK